MYMNINIYFIYLYIVSVYTYKDIYSCFNSLIFPTSIDYSKKLDLKNVSRFLKVKETRNILCAQKFNYMYIIYVQSLVSFYL